MVTEAAELTSHRSMAWQRSHTSTRWWPTGTTRSSGMRSPQVVHAMRGAPPTRRAWRWVPMSMETRVRHAGNVLLPEHVPFGPIDADDAIFRSVFARAPLAQCTVSLDATFMHLNPAASELLGYREDELVGQSFALVTHPDSLPAATESFQRMASGEAQSNNVDVVLVRKDGIEVEAEIYAAAVSDDDGRPLYFVALAHDVTERRRAERTYRHAAAHDALTELPNRPWFIERLSQALGRARRHGSMVALFFVDLDGFKPINDRLGHEAGDQVLYTVAGRIDRVVRPGDTVARYGGDEFTILCEDVPGDEQAIEIAVRILDAVSRKMRLSDGEVEVGASIGVVVAEPGAVTSTDLVAAADKAMYQAKKAGRGTYHLVRLVS